MTERFLLYDGACEFCADVAAAAERESRGWLNARPLDDPDLRAVLDHAGMSRNHEPLLVVRGSGRDRVYRGGRLAARLAFGLGPVAAFNVVHSIGRVGAQTERGRRELLRGAAIVGGALALPGFASAPPAKLEIGGEEWTIRRYAGRRGSRALARSRHHDEIDVVWRELSASNFALRAETTSVFALHSEQRGVEAQFLAGAFADPGTGQRANLYASIVGGVVEIATATIAGDPEWQSGVVLQAVGNTTARGSFARVGDTLTVAAADGTQIIEPDLMSQMEDEPPSVCCAQCRLIRELSKTACLRPLAVCYPDPLGCTVTGLVRWLSSTCRGVLRDEVCYVCSTVCCAFPPLCGSFVTARCPGC